MATEIFWEGFSKQAEKERPDFAEYAGRRIGSLVGQVSQSALTKGVVRAIQKAELGAVEGFREGQKKVKLKELKRK